MLQIDEINEVKENLRFIEDEIENIKREQIYIENISPIETKNILSVGIFLLFMGFSFICSTYFGISFQMNIILNAFTSLLALIFILAGVKLTKIGIKSKRISRRTKEIVGRAEKIKKRLEDQISKEQNYQSNSIE